MPPLLGSLADLTSSTSWWRLGGLVLLVPVVVFRERHLPLAWGVGAALSVVNPWYAPALFAMSYLVGRRKMRERPLEIAIAAGVVAATVLTTGMKSGHVTTWLNTAPLLVGAVTAWLAGRHRHQRRELELAGWQRAQHLEREQQLSVDRARIRERASIAQDMHDQLGHDLTLIAMLAAALEVSPRLDEASRSTASELRVNSAQAITRLGDIIGVLRVDASQEPAPSLREDVMSTVDRARTAGMLVELKRRGLDLPAPRGVEEAVQRVVKEALTNAAKHAPGAEIQVLLERLTDLTRVTITNEAPDGPPQDTSGSGMGLVGLAERVRVLGGTLTANPLDHGGFEVAARLPHSGAATAQSPGPAEAGGLPGAPVSAMARQRAERRVRRSLVAVVAVPVAATAAVAVLMIGYFSRTYESMTLDTDTYRGLRQGQKWEDLRSQLPDQQVNPRDAVEGPSIPEQASCRYYRADGGLFWSGVYRLCFTDGQLVTKDELREK
ncbi:sensor histidine kinase [Streptomyces sp. OR43]|uniref:sensor histidine kinase n=1 Tax=Streptomyces sp. or43 TaxID=2478957 RepID=UPI0011CD750C|nr:histidine kinase [Streptomyces sp. or43]